MFLEILISVAAVQVIAEESACDDSGTTIAVNGCLEEKLERSEARLERYLGAALKRYDDDEKSGVSSGIEASQEVFRAYRSIECGAVYEDFKDGTIRGAMSLGCQVELTDRRTHDIWRHWLKYMDSTPPILTEPAPSK